MSDFKKVIKSKKFKHGSYAVIFICVVVAFVIALNLIVSFLDDKYDLRFDLTESQLYSLSEDTDSTLKVALGDKYTSFDITITFCAARDMFEYYDAYRTDCTKYYSGVRDIAEEYAALYDGSDGKGKVTVNYVDITTDPAKANKLMEQTQLSTISWKNVIIQNTSNTEYYRVLGFDTFYFTDSDSGELYQFQAENKFTAAIIQCVSSENITVAFTKGHGETHSSRMEDIFVLSTMNVIEIDLDKEEIPEEVKVIVISNPLYDFTYGQGNGEIDKLSDFMSDKTTYNSLMVFVNADTPELPHLQDYLWEQWGLNYQANHKITDEEESLKGSKFENLIGTYTEGTTSSAAYVLCMRAKEADLDAIFPNSVALEVDTTGYHSQYCEVAVYSSKTSVATYKDSEGKEISEQGSYPILAVSTVHTYGNDDFNYNSNKYQYVMLCGSTDFVSEDYLVNSYGNESIMYAATRAMATDRVTLNIRSKAFEETALTLESGDAKRLIILITCALPALIVIVGIAVYFKRRHL